MKLQPAISQFLVALVRESHRAARPLLRPLILLLFLSFIGAPALNPSELRQPTIEAFNRYIQLMEARMEREVSGNSAFLYFESLPEPERTFYQRKLAHGDVLVLPMETRDQNKKKVPVPDGLIHHWVALVFLPGVRLSQALPVLQDYDHQADFYKPDIQRSRLITRDGEHFTVYMRLYRKAIVTAVYNAEFDIRYFPVDSSRIFSRSYSTRIAELQDPGKADERELTVGNDRGYLWRLYTYSRYEEKDGGLYMQIEFVALSRSVPFIFAWLVNPYIKSIPREYLNNILATTRTILTSPRQPTPANVQSILRESHSVNASQFLEATPDKLPIRRSFRR